MTIIGLVVLVAAAAVRVAGVPPGAVTRPAATYNMITDASG